MKLFCSTYVVNCSEPFRLFLPGLLLCNLTYLRLSNKAIIRVIGCRDVKGRGKGWFSEPWCSLYVDLFNTRLLGFVEKGISSGWPARRLG
jgi:hypothetical protein